METAIFGEVVFREVEVRRLVDLERDPWQMTNVVNMTSAAVLEHLTTMVGALYNCSGSELPLMRIKSSAAPQILS